MELKLEELINFIFFKYISISIIFFLHEPNKINKYHI